MDNVLHVLEWSAATDGACEPRVVAAPSRGGVVGAVCESEDHDEDSVADARSGRAGLDDVALAIQAELTDAAREYAREVYRLNLLLASIGEALRVSQPPGAGMIDIRWWVLRGGGRRSPVLVKWRAIGGGKGRSAKGRLNTVVKPERLKRFRPRAPAGDTLAAENYGRVVTLVDLAQRAIKRREVLVNRASEVLSSLKKSVFAHGQMTTEELTLVERLKHQSLEAWRRRTEPV